MGGKADIKQNYYAALELSNDASLEDIKKQYRKLALKHHPDRGGAVEKFQAIQAAHEILEDPVTKAKYDADRRRAGLVPTFSRPPPTSRPSAYNAGGPTYPPPPRRTATTNGTPGTSARPAGAGATGADRFTNFPRPAPTSRRESDKANVFTAWQNMNQAKKDAAAAGAKPQPQQQQQPRPQPRGAFGSTPQKPRQQPPRRDTTFPTEAEIRAGMNHHPAPGHSWFTDRGRQAWTDFEAQNAGKPGMARSNTTKTPKKSGFDPMAGGDEGQAGSTSNYSSYRMRTKSDDTRAYPPPPMPPRFPASTADFNSDSRNEAVSDSNNSSGDNDATHTTGTRVKTPYSSHIGQQKYVPSDNPFRSTGTRSTSHPTAKKTTPSKKSTTDGTARKPYIVEDSSDDPSSEAESSATTPENVQPNNKPSNIFENPFAARPKRTPVAPSSRTASPFKQPPFDSNTSSPFGSNKVDVGANNRGTFAQQASQAKGKDNIFNFSVDNDTFKPTAANTTRASKSEEAINLAFTPEEWAGTFNANNIFAVPVSAKKQPSPTRKPSRKSHGNGNQSGRPSSSSGAAPFAQYAGSANVQVPPTPPSPPRDPVKFSAEEWDKRFQAASWNFQPEKLKSDSRSSSRPTSTGARKASAKFSGAKIPVTTPKPATATAVEDEALQGDKAEAGAGAAFQAQAPAEDFMDIDMEGASPVPTTPSDFTATNAQKKQPKFVKVDPSDLRKSSASLEKESSGGPPLKTKLDDLASILSQSTTGEGLQNLADVASTLPFQSKPSSTIPTKSFTPKPLELPKMPIPPGSPVKLTKQSWHGYCETFSRYLAKFHEFDTAILNHFNARRVMETELLSRGASELESVGAEHWLDYKRAGEEDERVRLHWNIGRDKHLEAIKVFEGVRGRVRELSEGAGLADV